MSSIPDTDTALAGTQHTVTIEKLTFGGSGLAHVDGLPVFVEDSIPGQNVQIVITKRKDRYAEAKVQKVLRKAKDEIPARCPHFHDCGGCVWQNLPYDKQISYKEDIVRETLLHLTPVDDAVRQALPGRVLKIIPSPQIFHYRNKMEFSFGYSEMRSEEKAGKRIYFDEKPTVGFQVHHALFRPKLNTAVIVRCPIAIATPNLRQLMIHVSPLFQNLKLMELPPVTSPPTLPRLVAASGRWVLTRLTPLTYAPSSYRPYGPRHSG
jgi:tRNA/tmRNA/rRNA uracil-C5-methylase (TrmA/RlmC/RlmD family)